MTFVQRSRDRYVIYFVLFLALVGTLLKSIRLPNDWAEGHWLMTYEVGFIKRALPGTILNLFDLYNTPASAERVILLAAVLWFALFMAALGFVIWRILKRTNWQIPFVLYVILFVTSSFIVMTGNLFGYFDQIFHTGTIVVIWWVLRKRFIPAVILLSILILVHESVMVIGFPLVVLAFVFTHKVRSWSGVVVIVLPVVALILIIVYQSTFDSAGMYETLVARLESFSFVQLNRPVIVSSAYTTGFVEYLFQQMPYFPQRIFDAALSLRVYPFLGVSLLILVYGLWVKIKGWQFLMILFSVIAPLGLHLIAWDVERIWLYVILNAFLAVWICTEIYEPEPIPAPHMTLAFLFTLLIHIYGETPLLDNLTEREDQLMFVVRPLILIFLFYAFYFVKPIKNYMFVQGFAVYQTPENVSNG